MGDPVIYQRNWLGDRKKRKLTKEEIEKASQPGAFSPARSQPSLLRGLQRAGAPLNGPMPELILNSRKGVGRIVDKGSRLMENLSQLIGGEPASKLQAEMVRKDAKERKRRKKAADLISSIEDRMGNINANKQQGALDEDEENSRKRSKGESKITYWP
jgi:hypothetical protein